MDISNVHASGSVVVAESPKVLYDFIAEPRLVEEPIEHAVTHPDQAANGAADASARDLASAK